MSKSSFFLDFGILQHSILSSEAARVGWYVEGLMQRYVPQFHVFFLCGGVYCGPHHNATKGRSHYMYACIVYRKQCS